MNGAFYRNRNDNLLRFIVAINPTNQEGYTMKTLLTLGAVMAALVTFGASAEAGHGYRWGTGHGYSGGSLYGGYSPQVNTYPQTYSNYHRTWHNTSHYDYHPGSFQRHRNHLHYTPGHYDFHRTGHYDGHFHH